MGPIFWKDEPEDNTNNNTLGIVGMLMGPDGRGVVVNDDATRVVLGDRRGWTFHSEVACGPQFLWIDDEGATQWAPWAEAIERFGRPQTSS